MTISARFSIGDLVRHRLFGYRGVVYDVDPQFMLSDDWYETMAQSRPPRDRPWYRVLVHNGIHETYVAERNLEADDSSEPVFHPLIGEVFSGFEHGRYIKSERGN